MPLPSFTVRCLGKKLVAPGVYEFRVEKPQGFTFTAGQFAFFVVPAAGNPADVQNRAYSIASAPHDPELLFVIKIVKGGRAGAWFENVVSEGTTMTMQGPCGVFTLDRKTAKPYLFIATGTGIAPFRSQARSLLLEQGEKREIHLLFGVLKKVDMFWEEEWKKMEEEHPNFHAHISYLDGGIDWHGESGAVPDRACTIINASPCSIYLCGSEQIVKELKQVCLEKLQVPKEDVHAESFV
ncbi:MAG: FAD-binding oxidoreductase [Candidatus Peribacteraceae bacterium]|jgi:CDP-4-dehydro-6-deoxyglucose reductase